MLENLMGYFESQYLVACDFSCHAIPFQDYLHLPWAPSLHIQFKILPGISVDAFKMRCRVTRRVNCLVLTISKEYIKYVKYTKMLCQLCNTKTKANSWFLIACYLPGMVFSKIFCCRYNYCCIHKIRKLSYFPRWHK